jgi:hypothetical protein
VTGCDMASGEVTYVITDVYKLGDSDAGAAGAAGAGLPTMGGNAEGGRGGRGGTSKKSHNKRKSIGITGTTITTPDSLDSPDIRRAAKPSDRDAVAAEGDELRAAGKALPLCWLPEPQPRFVHPEMEADDPIPLLTADEVVLFASYQYPPLHALPIAAIGRSVGHDGPRDVRNGDRWLSHHYEEGFEEWMVERAERERPVGEGVWFDGDAMTIARMINV